LVGTAAMTKAGSSQCSRREYHLSIKPTMVLFPDPEGPTRAVFLPA
jgi:hypothetical protein